MLLTLSQWLALLLPAGLEATSSINSSQLQLQARQLHDMASSCNMLQQQLLALTNQVDPAAATLLAAAAAGDREANAAFCRRAGGSAGSSGSLAGQGSSVPDNSSGSSSLCRGLAACRFNADSTAGLTTDPAADAAAAVGLSDGPVRGGSGAGGGGMLRHLPVTMRLLLLEDSLQEVSSAMANKAAAGKHLQASFVVVIEHNQLLSGKHLQLRVHALVALPWQPSASEVI